MFYLETKDGDHYLTNKDSDDKAEFEKIIEAKLGADAASLFSSIAEDGALEAERYLGYIAAHYRDCLEKFENVLLADTLDKAKLEEVLSDFQTLYLDHIRR